MAKTADMTREDILAAAAQIHLDEAWQLREEQEAMRKRVNANKAALHDAVTLGHLNAEQAAEVEELYPTRERATPAERVAKLEEQLAKAREKVNGSEPAEQAA